jgi:hypothetical protein
MIKDLFLMGICLTPLCAITAYNIDKEQQEIAGEIITPPAMANAYDSLIVDGIEYHGKEISRVLDTIPSVGEMHSLDIKYNSKDVDYLAKVVYHEARGESLEGQQMIMDSIITRVQSPFFPNTIRGAISQRNAIAAYGKPQWGKKPPRYFYNLAESFLDGDYGKLPPEYSTPFWEGSRTLHLNRWAYAQLKKGNASHRYQIGNQIFWQHKQYASR